MRLIDADALEREGWKLHRSYQQDKNAMVYETKSIQEIPTAQPEPQWIPWSERLPEKDGYYLTTTCYRQVHADYWNEDHFDRIEAVIAWMPLPEPFKENTDA